MSAKNEQITPTYYVRHPDGSFSIAEVQPNQEQIAAQSEYVYAQCDRHHAGGVCEDPDCYLTKHGRARAAIAKATGGAA